jgi:hypothetical protein
MTLRRLYRGSFGAFVLDLVAVSALLELMEKRPDMTGAKLFAILPIEGHGFNGPWHVVRQLLLGKADEIATLT